MRSGLLLAILAVMMTIRSCQSSCEEQEPHKLESEERPGFSNFPRGILKRYNGIDYDSFVGLMGRRSAGSNDLPPPQKRDMHDFFVGLMGRRSSDSGSVRPWRSESPGRTGRFFFNKCKLRFRRGV
ncbi:hypothetical protein COCON_G00146460 [Conger conger]|uniref:Neurokinin-B n=1 Tax=Conger conger TaxID=82655 RepID=A0A9Q1HUF7_CONCO|nr:tachykinin-3a [Conger conger]KAJ8265547.1 hypothetical protein COCON_G00146460 [Conger conger]